MGALSGAAVNIILAPWWKRRRGAVSLAFNGATLGGVVIVSALLWLIGRVGFARARGWSPVLASNRGLGRLHLIARAQDGNPSVMGRFGPPIVSWFAGE
jgi:hypothetical protein